MYKNIKYRFLQLSNLTFNKLENFPLLSSLLLLVPLVMYIFISIALKNGLSMLNFNSDILAMIKGYPLAIYQCTVSFLPLISLSFIFFVKFNIQIFSNYKSYPISFYKCTTSNLLTLFIIIWSSLFLVVLSITIITKSPILGMINSFLILSLCITTILVSCYILQWIATYILIKSFTSLTVQVSSIISSLVITPCLIFLVNLISLSDLFSINPFISIFFSILIILLPFLIKITDIPNYIIIYNREIKISIIDRIPLSKINLFTNYLLLYSQNISSHVEFLFSFLITAYIGQLSKIMPLDSINNYLFILIMSLTTNGLVHHYQDWFSLRSKKIMMYTLITDFVVNLSILIFIYMAYEIISQNFVSVNKLIVGVSAYVITWFLQVTLKFRFSKKESSAISFIFFYSIIGTIFLNLFWYILK